VSRPTSHSRLAWTAACLALLACGTAIPWHGATGPGSEPAAFARASDEAPNAIIPWPWSKTPPAKLVKDPKSDPDAWNAYRNALKMLNSTDEHGRHCNGLGNVEDDRCRLVLTPVQGARFVPWNDLDELGYIVGKMKNVGTLRDSMFGIDPGKTAYWRVYRRQLTKPDGSTEVRRVSQLIDRETGQPLKRPTNAIWDSVQADGFDDYEFPLRDCHADIKVDGRRTSAKFRSCADAREEHEQGKAHVTTRHNSPSWITCLQGCCAVEGDP
jgi:hypothetical protein